MAKFTLEKSSKTALYAGIDYHKNFSVISLGDEKGEQIEQHKLWHKDVPSIKRFFKEHKGLSCAIESCRGYEWFLDLLHEMGVEVQVCNPVRMKIICQTAFKNDKIDSRKIMELLARNYLPTSYQPTPAERHLRERVRWRAILVRKGTSIRNSVKAVLAKENLYIKEPFSSKGHVFISESKISNPHRELLLDMEKALEANDRDVETQNEWLRDYVKQDVRVELLKTIPGIGDVSAIALMAEIGNVERFQSASQLASYFGLVPRLVASADKSRHGRITKEGSSLVRWLLVQDAWTAVRRCREFRRRYQAISKRRGKQIAIVAIARKLVEVAFCVLRDQKPFCESKLSKTD